MKTKDRIFYGVEVEGMWRGFRTAFVPASLIHSADTVLGDYTGAHIYLGAGEDTICEEHWEDCRRLVQDCLQFRDACFTLELMSIVSHSIPLWAVNNPRVRLIITQTIPEHTALLFRGSQVELKCDDGSTAIIFSNPQVVSLAYNSDTEEA